MSISYSLKNRYMIDLHHEREEKEAVARMLATLICLLLFISVWLFFGASLVNYYR